MVTSGWATLTVSECQGDITGWELSLVQPLFSHGLQVGEGGCVPTATVRKSVHGVASGSGEVEIERC